MPALKEKRKRMINDDMCVFIFQSSLLSFSRSESFLSAFSQLRSGYCPYLYVCTHQFTVLFKNMKTSKNDSTLSAVLTPTTRGLREALKKEGVLIVSYSLIVKVCVIFTCGGMLYVGAMYKISCKEVDIRKGIQLWNHANGRHWNLV